MACSYIILLMGVLEKEIIHRNLTSNKQGIYLGLDPIFSLDPILIFEFNGSERSKDSLRVDLPTRSH